MADETRSGSPRDSRAIVAWILLALLHASAIYAPLVANDRPLFLHAIDHSAVRAAALGLAPAVDTLQRLRAQSDEEYERGRVTGSTLTRARATTLELDALERRLGTLATYVASEDEAPLGALETAIARVRAQPGLDALPALREACERVRDSVKHARLVAVTSFPLFAALSHVDVFCMVLWPLLVLLPLVNAPQRLRRALQGCALAFTVSLLAPVPSFVPAADFKRRLASGDLEATHALFPPVAMGFGETNLSEVLRPPTWTRAAEIDDDGRYVNRTPAAGGALAMDGAFTPPPTRVDVRFAEPPRNAAARHVLGTDSVGRDLFARTLWGGRISLAVGLFAALGLTCVGTVLGALAGYFAGRTDLVISRALEIVLAFPALFLILLVLSLADPDALPPVLAIALVIAAVGWTGVARLVRAEVLRLREREFVLAARSLGFSHARIVLRHVLPNALGPIVVAFVFAVAGGILTESALAFLGFGARHPYPSWGALINESRAPEHWWIQVFPGAFIFATVVAYNLAGESLQQRFAARTPPHSVMRGAPDGTDAVARGAQR